MSTDGPSLQERYSPNGECFGCGPANAKGLRIRSMPPTSPAPDGSGEVLCVWTPEPHHLAGPGILNGGICGALLDCHSNWTAAYHLMKRHGADAPPFMVTAAFAVKLKRPTPLDTPIHLSARVTEISDDRATVEATLSANGKVTATCTGVFVAVKEGHPAYRPW